jgi:hypothetical protein
MFINYLQQELKNITQAYPTVLRILAGTVKPK